MMTGCRLSATAQGRPAHASAWLPHARRAIRRRTARPTSLTKALRLQMNNGWHSYIMMNE